MSKHVGFRIWFLFLLFFISCIGICTALRTVIRIIKTLCFDLKVLFAIQFYFARVHIKLDCYSSIIIMMIIHAIKRLLFLGKKCVIYCLNNLYFRLNLEQATIQFSSQFYNLKRHLFKHREHLFKHRSTSEITDFIIVFFFSRNNEFCIKL